MATTTKNRCASIACNKIIKATSTYCPACTEKREAADAKRNAFKHADLTKATAHLVDAKVEKTVYVPTTEAEWGGVGAYCIGKIVRYRKGGDWSLFDEDGGSVRFGGAKQYPYDGATYIHGAKTQTLAIEVLVLWAEFRLAGRKDSAALAAFAAENGEDD
jgi:hypothetical protein